MNELMTAVIEGSLAARDMQIESLNDHIAALRESLREIGYGRELDNDQRMLIARAALQMGVV